ncbi:MAG: HDOD domain-containing protein [Desulfobacterales bacterium]|nr:HDOD domain-containing protein [Desulfobacterales bacterium]
MDIFVARQPIFDRDKKVAAYELLFRDSMENYMSQDVDGDKATSSVLSRSFMNFGLDSIASGKMVFINFTKNLLINQIPTIFPAKQTVVEILEDIEPTDDVINACLELKKANYIIALDDFIFDPNMQRFVDLADIIKVDFMDAPKETIEREVVKLPKNIKLLAEKVETWEEYKFGLDLGFEYFQGYFFSKPEIIKGKDFSAMDISLVELIAEVNKEEPNYDKVIAAISKDVSISYKLLSLMNSALFKRVVEVKSIRETLNYLGQNEFKRFISVISMSNLSKASNFDISILSCIRARFCELLAEKCGMNTQEAFAMGLFSMIDAVLGKSIEELMKMLPLSEDIKSALVDRKGELYKILFIVQEFEKGEFWKAEKIVKHLKMNFDEIPEVYKEALAWADIIKSKSKKK